MHTQSQNLRTIIWPLLNPDTGALYLHRFSWKDIEKGPGLYDWSGIEAAVLKARNIKRYALVRIEPDAPAWSKDPEHAFMAFLDAMGEVFGGERVLWGIDVVCPGKEEDQSLETLQSLAACYARNFPFARKFVRAGSRLEALLEQEPLLGIVTDASSLSPEDERWKRIPFRMSADPQDPDAAAWAAAHHISILTTEDPKKANTPTHTGYRFQVLKVRTDCAEQTDGYVRARLTVANAGTLPCYSKGQFRLRLSGSGIKDLRVYDLPLRAEELMPGEERDVACDLDIRGLSRGEYDVHAGLFLDGTEYPVSFGIEGRISDGYYEGRLILCL